MKMTGVLACFNGFYPKHFTASVSIMYFGLGLVLVLVLLFVVEEGVCRRARISFLAT